MVKSSYAFCLYFAFSRVVPCLHQEHILLLLIPHLSIWYAHQLFWSPIGCIYKQNITVMHLSRQAFQHCSFSVCQNCTFTITDRHIKTTKPIFLVWNPLVHMLPFHLWLCEVCLLWCSPCSRQWALQGPITKCLLQLATTADLDTDATSLLSYLYVNHKNCSHYTILKTQLFQKFQKNNDIQKWNGALPDRINSYAVYLDL